MNKALFLLGKIRVHPLLWLVIALAVMTAHFIELSMMLLIIFIHELGHATAASFFSWRIKSISMLPFGGVAELDEHGNRPLKEEAIVVLAGPAQHIWLIGLSFLFLKLGLVPEHYYLLFVQYNLMVLFFNLLPIWPLDGGKLVFLFLSMKSSFTDAHRQMVIGSIIALCCFVTVLIFTVPLTLNIWIVVSFLVFSIFREWKHRRFVFLRFLLERHYGKEAEFRTLKTIKVSEKDLLITVLEKFQRGCKHPIIVEVNGEETALDENEILHAFFAEKQLTAKIGDLLYSY
ncbi:M50 family metallopeptidase [Mesobacillus harenae]|uniref:M50 family metallopeptidase n=1 Tax=Mesobacillus harenae TaxID=2213203 RepID=UPI001580ED0B|nr:M50 family metallopeptidase [Mesobacillus harenae]